MPDRKKLAIGLGIAGAAAALIYAATRKPPPVPPEEGAATIRIEVLGPGGVPVESRSPVTLDEGTSYTVRVTVTNQTTRGGVPWGAALTVRVMTSVNFILPEDRVETFSPNETRAFDYPLDIPMGFGGLYMSIDAYVIDSEGFMLATASEPVNIREVVTIYGATISIGV